MERLQYFKSLLELYIDGNLSSKEEAELWEELARRSDDAEWEQMITAFFTSAEKDPNYNKQKWDFAVATILTRDNLDSQSSKEYLQFGDGTITDQPTMHRVHFLKTTWFRYAAILLLIVGTATYLYNIQSPQEVAVQHTPSKQPTDIPPGGNKATLTLSDGSIIVLDSAHNGSLASQGNTTIIKLDAGKLEYQGNQLAGETGYNKISTPNGGQYQIVLSDGTKVWLNAASSIRFPATFGKGDRIVEITGESYLEVVSDKSRPFIVKTAQNSIRVLGTRFNVHAYADEAEEKISLAEGSIQVGKVLLKPGQAYAAGQVASSNLEQDLAWKHGIFDFNKVTIQQAMSQIARWYDVDVIYEKNIPTITLGGKMRRNMTLSEVLEFVEGLGVHYTLNDRELIIKP